MVRKYKRKSNRADYGVDRLNEAVNAVIQGQLTMSMASVEYNIPYITIYSRVKGLRGKKSTTQGRSTILSWADENRLAENIRTMEKWGYGLTTPELTAKVRDFVVLNNIPNPFKNNIPGKDWVIYFKTRHALSVKKPQSLEYCRKKSTDPFLIGI